MYHFGFIVEQTLGHVTHGLNLQKQIARDPTVHAEWGLPAWGWEGLAGKIPLVRNNWTLQAGLRTRKILADLSRSRPDALFFHTQVTAVLSPDWLRRIPGVVSLDATPRQYDRLGAFYTHTTGPAWLEQWKWRLNRDCFRLARRLVTWSEWAKRGLVEEYEVPSGKITVIPPGVDTRAWEPLEPKNRREGEPVKILFVGGDLKRKGGQLLIEVFRSFRGRAELHLVTREPVSPEPGVFVYPDMQPNAPALKQLYHACDIFCLPTFGDCLPMALSEAGAAGLPSISTRVAAIPEIILDGETGYLVPPGDGQALRAALQRLIDDPELRWRQGLEAARGVKAHFDAPCNAMRLLDLMKEVADEAGSREGYSPGNCA